PLACTVMGVELFGGGVVVPFAMGTIAGAVASGRVRVDTRSDHVTVWLNPTSLLGGVLAVTTCAYLAAVFLVADAQHRQDLELARYFTRRAFVVAGVTGVVALVGIFIVDRDAPSLHHGLTHDGLPFVAASAVFGLSTLVVLARRPGSLLSRVLAIGAVAAVVTAWGVAQYPDMLPGELSIKAAASPTVTLIWLAVIAAVALAIVAPSFGLLYLLAQRGALEGDDLAASITGPAGSSPHALSDGGGGGRRA
ncbi:MAG: cytochrome d ubiquinol oxidase subunit II, partial [Ilumatobacteraceae bacterium]